MSGINGVEYVVGKGETISSIARKFHVEPKDIERTNSQIKNPDKILPGDVIVIPKNERVDQEEIHADILSEPNEMEEFNAAFQEYMLTIVSKLKKT